MSGPYPGGMTGDDRHFSGRWWCAGEHYTTDSKAILHPFTGEDYCGDCVERMKEDGRWPLKCETCDGQGYLQNLLKCPDCKEGWR